MKEEYKNEAINSRIEMEDKIAISTSDATRESMRSQDSIFMVARGSDSNVVTDRHSGSWLTSKSMNVIAETMSVDPHPPSFLNKVEEDFFDDSIMTPFPQVFSSKKVHVTDSAISHPSSRLKPTKVMHSKKKPVNAIRSCMDNRQQTDKTVFSDWGDVYEGLGTVRFTQRGSIVLQRGLSSSWSDHVTGRECRLSLAHYEVKKIKLAPGKVMGMYLGKLEYRFQILELKWTLHDVINTFLAAETGARLPISFDQNEQHRPRIMSMNRMEMSVAENLGPQFDAKTKGLTFSTGSVNSKLCYKMSVCELTTMEKIFAISCNESNFQEE